MIDVIIKCLIVIIVISFLTSWSCFEIDINDGMKHSRKQYDNIFKMEVLFKRIGIISSIALIVTLIINSFLT